MKSTYITITGADHYFGHSFIKPNMIVRLVKEPENNFDHEAIRVELPGLGKIGYVANSPRTVLGESISAGRLYDRIEGKAFAQVLYVLHAGVVCRLICKPDSKKHFRRGLRTKAAAFSLGEQEKTGGESACM